MHIDAYICKLFAATWYSKCFFFAFLVYISPYINVLPHLEPFASLCHSIQNTADLSDSFIPRENPLLVANGRGCLCGYLRQPETQVSSLVIQYGHLFPR